MDAADHQLDVVHKLVDSNHAKAAELTARRGLGADRGCAQRDHNRIRGVQRALG